MKPVSTGTTPAFVATSTVWLWPPRRGSASYRVTRWRRASSHAAARPEMPAPTTAISSDVAGSFSAAPAEVMVLPPAPDAVSRADGIRGACAVYAAPAALDQARTPV